MNVLYIACSCSPYHGSEDKIGWNIPLESAKTNRVFVITRDEQRKYIEQYTSQHPVENINFHYVSLNPFCERILRFFPFTVRLNLWNCIAFNLARKLCRTEDISIIHQITPIEFRSIGNYGKIPGVKFVCGPLGGGERLPTALYPYASGHLFAEWIRDVLNQCCRMILRIGKKLEHCDYVLFANHETERLFVNQVPSNKRTLTTEIGVDETEFSGCKKQSEPTTFLVASRLVYRKGHALLLDALEGIPQEMNYRCNIVGDGEELASLQARCAASHIHDRVTFVGAIPYGKMRAEYEQADVFVMPSIRETTGTVLLEAMAKGIPVVTIKKFGGAIIADDSTGWLYEGTTREEYVEHLKDALISCITQPDEVRRRGENARQRAMGYTWEEKMKMYQKIYNELTSGDGTI